MSKILCFSFFLLLVLSVPACKKSFFDANTEDGSVNDGSAFKTKKDFEAALIGVYASLQGGNAAGDAWVKVPGFCSQDIVDISQNPKPIATYMTPGNSVFQDYWAELYKIVASANLVLEKLTTAPPELMTAAEKTSIEAQAKFLRGFAYFSLARAFGSVPMPLAAYNPAQNSISCTEEAQVWDQVIADIAAAAAALPEGNEYSPENIGRVTKGAALAYLANAHMYKKDWTKAATASTDLFALNNPKYEMAASVRTAFSILNKNTDEYKKENVFEVQYREKAGDNFSWGGVPNTGHLMFANTGPRGIGDTWAAWGGWGETLINLKAIQAYEAGDDRRTHLAIAYGEKYKGELMADTLYPSDWSNCSQTASGFAAKYWLGPEKPSDYSGLSSQNLPQMRFSEVLLNYAEILFNQGKTNEAYDELNKVRTRAKLAPRPASGDAAVFMQHLMNERRFELLFEPNLWFHYTRTGTAAKFLQDNYGISMQPKWNHFPIPQRERDINPNICSNGY